MGKTEKAKNAARVSAREKTVNSPQDIQPRTVPDGRSTLIPSREPGTGWQTHSTKTSTMYRYVHVTDASLSNAVKKYDQSTILAS